MSRRPSQKKPKKPNKLQKRARRDVKLSIKPQVQSIRRENQQARRDYEHALAAANAAYSGFQQQLAGQPDLSGQINDIAGQLQQQLAQFSNMLGGAPVPIPSGMEAQFTQLPATEKAAGTNLYGGYGAGGLEQLYNMAARGKTYQASQATEGALAQRNAGENLLQQLQDILQGNRDRRLDLFNTMPQSIRQREDELRQIMQQNQLVKSQIASNNALGGYVTSQAQNWVNKNNKDNNPNNPNPRPKKKRRPGNPVHPGQQI